MAWADNESGRPELPAFVLSARTFPDTASGWSGDNHRGMGYRVAGSAWYELCNPETASLDDVRIFYGTLRADLLLGYARSLKDRRKPLQALTQRLRNRGLAVAQVGPTDLTRRAFLAIAAVSGSETQLGELLDGAERVIFASEFEIADLNRDITSASYRSS